MSAIKNIILLILPTFILGCASIQSPVTGETKKVIRMATDDYTLDVDVKVYGFKSKQHDESPTVMSRQYKQIRIGENMYLSHDYVSTLNTKNIAITVNKKEKIISFQKMKENIATRKSEAINSLEMFDVNTIYKTEKIGAYTKYIVGANTKGIKDVYIVVDNESRRIAEVGYRYEKNKKISHAKINYTWGKDVGQYKDLLDVSDYVEEVDEKIVASKKYQGYKLISYE